MVEKAISDDVPTVNLLSNLYNNLSNTYLYLRKPKEALESMQKAFEIRMEYAHLGLLESHDTLQQMANLANMLIIGNELEQARELLTLYEQIVLQYGDKESLDYGICQVMYGFISLQEKKPVEAEHHLLAAEQIISTVMGTDNDYMKTVYRYLHALYTRWRKPELAQKYKDKLLLSRVNLLKEKNL